ncbi:MAG TPA: EAL domain-containing protein [Solirubrobacteraceae bacterium]|nr:EAL domain-containing protein [Solirubrobacteraceae bacterium]
MDQGKGLESNGRAQAPIRVLIAEDDPEFRSVLGEVVAGETSLRLVASAVDAAEAAVLAERERPDVALVDVRMPAGGGVNATERIRALSPRTKVVALTAHTDPSLVLEMLRAGAVGYVVKGSPMHDVLDAVHAALRGESSLAGPVARDVVSELAARLERQRHFEDEFGRRRRRIRTAIDDGQPVAVFQPVVRLVDGGVVGVEALARFDSALTESPLSWFEDAETVDMRAELELAAVRAAALAAQDLAPELWISFNVSPLSALHPDRLLDALAPLPPDRLVIEITEQAQVQDYDELNVALGRLREAGMRIAVDDAGAGYASLRHILRLEPDIIKLDKSLVRGVHQDRARRALATALISFAAEIEAMIVAEGIETAEELDALRELGVTYGQGYHLARPHRPPVESLVAVA